ncbi:MAG TPA: glycosyltransferase family 2 protein [Candidatus Saccharimonadales bacterium]|nr:glycosyltransferase family 2 protein [Candidatus Saccharimonadales bacterium]
MKLVIQIPCLNEESTLPLVLKSVPSRISGVDEIETLVIDDGSTDQTVQIARDHGVSQFVVHRRTRGLGRSFHDGIERALQLGADIVVNTDGDNQYPQDRIADLIRPILEGRADIVVADRQIHTISHFSPFKKFLQRLGSKVVNYVAGTNIPDAASGFRAYSKEALMQLNTISRFSYCTESIIQAGDKRLSIVSVPVTTNPKTRESRLFKSNFEHVLKSAGVIIRAYIMYKPYVIFTSLSLGLLGLGLVPFVRYLYFAFQGERGSHLQSLIIGAVLLIGSFLSLMLGILADLTRTNRILHEQQLERTKRLRFDT